MKNKQLWIGQSSSHNQTSSFNFVLNSLRHLALTLTLLGYSTIAVAAANSEDLWNQINELVAKVSADPSGMDVESRVQLNRLLQELGGSSLELVPVAEYRMTVEPGDFPVFEGIDDSISFEQVKSLRDLFEARKYHELNAELDKYQRYFEADYSYESALGDAYRAISGVPGSVDDWVASTPTEYTATLAAGARYSALAWKRRGSGFSQTVNKQQMSEFKKLMAKSLEYLNQTIELRPESVVAHRLKAEALKALGRREELSKQRAVSLEQFPDAFWLRWTYINSLLPRWGGSLGEVAEFSIEQNTNHRGNPKMPILLGVFWIEKGDQARAKKDFDAAERHYKKALEYGDFNVTRGALALTFESMDKLERAREELERAVAFRPMSSSIQRQYARVLTKLGMVKESKIVYEKAVFLDPLENLTSWENWASSILISRAQWKAALGDKNQSVKLFAEASSIDSENIYTLISQGDGLMQMGPARHDEAEAVFEKIISKWPADINGYAKLSFLKKNSSREIDMIPLWSQFIAIAPSYQLPLALSARGDVYKASGQLDLASLDFKAVCEIRKRLNCQSK